MYSYIQQEVVKMQITIKPSARKYMQKHQIECVTFKMKMCEPMGCCVGIVKEIESVPESPPNASHYRYFQCEGKHIYVYRDIKILGPLTITTEGLWRLKRLSLDGATIPL